MPGMRGWDLAARLKSHQPGTKVLYMSGYSEEAVLDQGGGHVTRQALIAKPFTAEALLQRVRQALTPTGAPCPAALTLGTGRPNRRHQPPDSLGTLVACVGDGCRSRRAGDRG